MLQTGYERGTKDSDVLETAGLTQDIKAQLLAIAGQGSELHQRHRLYVDIVQNQSTMSPRARPKPVKVELVKVSPATERAIREGVRAIQRGGNTRALTRAELDRLAETGEFPWRDEPRTSKV